MLPSEVLDIASSDYDLLELYWQEEPWGPWRDNLHAAVVARTLLKAGGYRPPKLDVFMYKGAGQRFAEERAARKGMIEMLKNISVRKRKSKSGNDFVVDDTKKRGKKSARRPA